MKARGVADAQTYHTNLETHAILFLLKDQSPSQGFRLLKMLVSDESKTGLILEILAFSLCSEVQRFHSDSTPPISDKNAHARRAFARRLILCQER